MKEIPHNVENHFKNLHGSEGVDGLTGRYKGTYYDRGVPRLPIEKILPKGGTIYERVREI
jgi:hypothetical protein